MELVNGQTNKRKNINSFFKEIEERCDNLEQGNGRLFDSNKYLAEDNTKKTVYLNEVLADVAVLKKDNTVLNQKVQKLSNSNETLKKRLTDNSVNIERLSIEAQHYKTLYSNQQRFIEEQNEIVNKTQQQLTNIQTSYDNLLHKLDETEQEVKLQYKHKHVAIKWCIALAVGWALLFLINLI